MSAGRTRHTALEARRSGAPGEPGNSNRTLQSSGRRVFLLPFIFTVALLGLSYMPRIEGNAVLVRSFWGASAVLLVWLGTLFLQAGASPGRSLYFRVRPQHWLQAVVQVAVFAYWGWFWHPVYDFVWLLAAQLAFAYAFDVLLSWSRRETYVLGFGPFPIIFSINLFLWFRDDWFFLQFLMIAVGFLGKEFVRWHREGRVVHIFNPSAFSLGLFSLALIATGSTDLTWGQEIASTLTLAPRISLFLFLMGLIVMYFFAITLVAGSAAVVLFALSAAYSAATGVPYFLDSEIPAAVFLGLHLLITDPSTSPKTSLGKSLFGALYGLGVFGLYALLGSSGAPTFYDKLLCVPLLNLSVPMIDRLFRSVRAGVESRGLLPQGAKWQSNLAHMSAWIVFFGAMSIIGKTDSRHAGDAVPFWEKACADGRVNACGRLMQVESTYCADNSGWACNELGGHYVRGERAAPDPELALAYFTRACEAGFMSGCVNLLEPESAVRSTPRPLDLRLMLREGGKNLMEMSEPELYARACEHRWEFACVGVGS